MTIEKYSFITKVHSGEQAIILTLLARNEDGVDLLDSQLELALNMAKNVVQMTGADVNASGSIVSFNRETVAAGASAKIVATVSLTDPVAE